MCRTCLPDKSVNSTSTTSGISSRRDCPEPSCEKNSECPNGYLCTSTGVPDFCVWFGYCVPGCNTDISATGFCPEGETCYHKPGDGEFRYKISSFFSEMKSK